MTTKKATTKKTAKSGRTIKDLARAIIEDVRGYDLDTREAVGRALKRGDAADLAETVKQAESGMTILDVAGVAEEYEESARMVVGLLDRGNLPDFMTRALLDALDAAGGHFGGHPFKAGPDGSFDTGGLSVKALANLFALANGENYRPPETPAASLAEQISAVLRNPETPEQIREGILKGMTLYDEDVTDPAYVGLILAAAKEAGRGRATVNE